MTEKEKIDLINRMISDVIEFTDYDKGALDALVNCISAVAAFESEDDEQE